MRRSRFGGPEPRPASHRDDDRRDAVTPDVVEHAAALLAERWKSALLYVLASGYHRYTAIARQLPDATPKMLTQQLREMERDGLLIRVVHSGGPRHVEYRLTPMGEALRPVVEALATWGDRYQEAARAGAEETERGHPGAGGVTVEGDAR